MAAKTFAEALARGLAPSEQKAVHWIRPASVPQDAGDGFAYNAPWQMISAAGRPISERGILQLSAAMGCIRLLSQTIATLPITIFRRLPDGGRKAAYEHPLYELLHNQPNKDMSAVDFWQVMIASMLLRGNAFAEKLRIGDRIVGIDFLDPSRVSWTAKSDGSLQFFYADAAGKRRKLAPDDIWQIPAFTLDGKLGISPICYGASVFGGALAAEDASQSIFANGMSASGYVTTQPGQWLTPEQREKMRGHLDEFSYQAANSRKSFILEGGMGYTQLSMNPEDAQMLETRSFNVEEICRWFGVPPTLIGHGEKTSNWGTGLEQQNIAFLTYSLTPWLRKIEQSIRRALIAPGEKGRYFAEFNVTGLLRGDTAARASYYSQMVNNGLMTRDEVRRLENLPAMGGNAEVLTVQTALSPLDKLGEDTEEAPTAPATPDEEQQ